MLLAQSSDATLGSQMALDVLKAKPSGNFCVSPTSLQLAGAMLRAGAQGESDTILARLLGQSRTTEAAARAKAVSVQKGLARLRSQGVLNLANGLWVDDRGPVRASYVQAMKRDLDAQVTRTDLGAPGAAGRVNEWVSRQTKGRIPKLFDEFGPGAAAVLVNALSLDDKWQEPFTKIDDAPFASPGGRVTAKMMSVDGSFSYRKVSGQFETVVLPYRSGLAMHIALPAGGKSVASLFQPNSLASWLARPQGSLKYGWITMPRWKHEFSLNLAESWKKQGGARLFQPGISNFPRMIDARDSFLSQAIQKTMIEVDEEGTKAAAATGMEIGVTSAPPQKEAFRLLLDRPFAYAIVDSRSGAILFLGAVQKP